MAPDILLRHRTHGTLPIPDQITHRGIQCMYPMSKHVGCCLSTHKHQDVTDRDCSIHTPSRLDADRLLYDSSHYIAIRLICQKLHII